MKKHKTGSGFGFGKRTMTVERLESRAMLAGNVTASVSGGSLMIRGDNAGNGVLVAQEDNGNYLVAGLDVAGSPTTINGQANFIAIFSGVTGDVNIDLRGGGDLLGIGNSIENLESLAQSCGFGFGLGGGGETNGGETDGGENPALVEPVPGQFFVPRNLIVNTADGNDNVAVNADVNGFVLINTGNGNDNVAFGNPFQAESDVNVDTNLTVLTGDGNDDVCISLVTLDGLLNLQTGNGNDNVQAVGFDAGQVLVLTGSGNDRNVLLAEFDTDRGVVVDTGSGNDGAFLVNFSAGQGFGPNEQTGAGYVTVNTGDGNDEVEMASFEADGVVVNTGSGNDGAAPLFPIAIAAAEITNHLIVNTAGGNDRLEIIHVDASTVVVNSGEGNDNVAVRSFSDEGGASPEIGNLTVNTQGGADSVTLRDLEIRNNLFASLGSGNDFLNAVGLSVGGLASIDAGDGADRVRLADSLVNGNTMIFMGAGNDTLTIVRSSGNGRLLARGGAGSDTFINDLGVDSNGAEGDSDVREFEVFGTPPSAP